MQQRKMLTIAAAIGLATASLGAQAGMVTDAQGNVGYDTAAECDAAVQAGTAKFYTPFTRHKALLRKGEKSVRAATLRDLGEQYANGACDLGVGRKLGRDGVSTALQGKYVPFSPDMPVNVYLDASGKAVRATMGQCDNWFSGNAPRPVQFVREETAAPAPVEPEIVPVAPVAAKKGLRPYLFGTVGALQNGVEINNSGAAIQETWKDTRAAGQVGAGVQFNDIVGVEAYYQGGEKHRFGPTASDKVRNHTYGTRLTLGSSIGDKFRLFAKVGAAGVKHKLDSSIGYNSKTKVRPTAGIGATFALNDNLAIRADYDHVFKRGSERIGNADIKWRNTNYLGAGIQYTF